jgi:hypothetical protein
MMMSPMTAMPIGPPIPWTSLRTSCWNCQGIIGEKMRKPSAIVITSREIPCQRFHRFVYQRAKRTKKKTSAYRNPMNLSCS